MQRSNYLRSLLSFFFSVPYEKPHSLSHLVPLTFFISCVVKFLVVLLTVHVVLFFSNQLLSHKRHLMYLGQTIKSKSTSTSSVIKKENDSLEAFSLIHRYRKIIKCSESNYLGILIKTQNIGMFVRDCSCIVLSTLK